MCCSESDWSKLCNLHPIFCGPLWSTVLHPVLASSFSSWQDFSKRAGFSILCVDWFYKKAVWGVVKSWEFEGDLRCSKILRIRRKNPMKWVLSISRDYWVYLDITLQSFEIWEFWGEFWGIETFYWSKFSPATGVRQRHCNAGEKVFWESQGKKPYLFGSHGRLPSIFCALVGRFFGCWTEAVSVLFCRGSTDHNQRRPGPIAYDLKLREVSAPGYHQMIDGLICVEAKWKPYKIIQTNTNSQPSSSIHIVVSPVPI